MIEFISQNISSYFHKGFHLNPLFVLAIVWFFIQLIKIIIDSIRHKKFHTLNIFSAWWFPSFHAGVVSSISAMILIEYWFDSILFALSCWLSLLVAYDAMNVRFESWQQAKYINEIRSSIKSTLVMDKRNHPLKERLWHTPLEVVWWVVIWFVSTLLLYYYFVLS